MSDSSSSSSFDMNVFPIPGNYKLVDFIGSGGFGTVTQCRQRDTGEAVAIKISRHVQAAKKEATILEELMSHRLDQSNIVKFYGWYHMNGSTGLVMEMLDMGLDDYMKGERLPLADIRLFMQQLARAFDGLKSVGVIHADLKPNNIMLVKNEEQHWMLKLIDFSLAFHRSEAVVGSRHQLPFYRAPEIMLGLPFDEAIDMWSLGVLMGQMMFGQLIFPWFFEYNQLQTICEILGPPKDHLLDAGLKTKEFFMKTPDDKWTFKTQDEYWQNKICFDTKSMVFHSLDDLKELSEEMGGDGEAWRQCIELLKAMLQVDASKRITPREVLSHPFITQSYLHGAVQPAADEPSCSSRTDVMGTDAVTETYDRAQSEQTQDSQGDDALDHLSDALCCDTGDLNDEVKEIPPLALRSESQDITSGETDVHKDKKKNNKKKAIRRFFSWMRRSFTCCRSGRVEDCSSP